MSSESERIYTLVRHIPRGKVTTYGQLGTMCGITDSRVVGDAMNASQNVPWQRVINSRGEISLKGATGARQRQLLEEEGVEFDEAGRVDFARFGWTPDNFWLLTNGYAVPPPLVAPKRKESDDDPQLSLL